jgi:hypothetical protein
MFTHIHLHIDFQVRSVTITGGRIKNPIIIIKCLSVCGIT